ncbi:uncharacterized protein BDZ83DRAFT_603963 [Colletotrichum acutatum]|uniref:Uncharacterized protein n=1 Tax=Glomerella acutata TaxID=27357 RepID=A0AAD8XM17_GLOAC|nr:uncharacterized protein BDZ83DRAFT_603963 [Colletotrichum acutatum]KAK1729920.1 hypothetical protein BDZ83DRAFT_603963 [Colletotrichum acutatum]
MGERTGSRVFQWVWSYVVGEGHSVAHHGRPGSAVAFLVVSTEPRNLHMQGDLNEIMGR